MKATLFFFHLFVISLVERGVTSNTLTDQDLKTFRQSLPTNALLNKVIGQCPIIVSNFLLYDVVSQFNSSEKVPISFFVDVFRLAEINDLTRR